MPSFPEIREALSQAKDLVELEDLLRQFVQEGWLDQNGAASLYDEFGPQIDFVGFHLFSAELYDYVSAYTSPSDLADRLAYLLRQGNLPDELTAGSIYNRLLGKMADRKELDEAEANLALFPDSPQYQDAMATAQRKYKAAQAVKDKEVGMNIRAGIVRLETTAAKAERLRGEEYVTGLNLIEEAKYKYALAEEKAAREAEVARLKAPRIEAAKREYLPSLRAVLDAGVRSGTITPEQAEATYADESSLLDRGFNLSDLPNYPQVRAEYETEQERQAIELEQINLAPRIKEANRQLALQELLGRSEEAGLKRLLAERQWQAQQPELPEQPSYTGVYEPFLAGIGAPNFRRFIESKLGRIAEETAGARAAWWRAKNPLQPMPFMEAATPTFESLLAGARADVRERGDILREAQLGTSTALLPGGVQAQEYWTGQLPYAAEQKGLSETRLADLLELGQEGYFAQQRAIPKAEPRVPKIEPTTAPDPFKTALETYPFLEEFMKLSPGERGYQKSRFAPRVQYRF